MTVKLGILANGEWRLYELTEREADTASLDTGFFWYLMLMRVSLNGLFLRSEREGAAGGRMQG
jgi:hypothetical protein